MSKTKMFKNLIHSNKTEYFMEAHNAISAEIVEEAGFKGIWGSSLTISASMGARDNNEMSWSQVLDVVEPMCNITNIPLLLDADSGYGNFNNIRYILKKMEQIDVAAVCMEDKVFPKINSFIHGEKQPLADINEFCGKIHAIKDSQRDPDFCMIARIETFIAGYGLDEALKRAEAYYNAGADALFVHSKKSTPEDIVAFMNEWKDTCPVIITPSTYFNTSSELFEDLKISIVVWANQMMRASIYKMQEIARRIQAEKSIVRVNDEIASVKEIFRLQNMEEFLMAEKKYLPES